MIFPMQFGINKHFISTSKTTNCTCPILVVFEIIHWCLFIPNCTRNRVITCTNLLNRPFPSCFEPHYESEAKCKAFIMKISVQDSYSNKTNFNMKSFALSLAFITRFPQSRPKRVQGGGTGTYSLPTN